MRAARHSTALRVSQLLREAVFVVAGGANRVGEAKVATHLGDALARADADFVRDATGHWQHPRAYVARSVLHRSVETAIPKQTFGRRY